MTTYTFALQLAGRSSVLDDETLNSLYEAGCSDASFSERAGAIYADFAREAPSFQEAVSTAVAQIEKVSSLRVLRVEDEELVGIPDIAARVRRTRQSVWQLVKGERGPKDFPEPVVRTTGDRSLWRWSEVADWFAHRHESPAYVQESREFLAMANALLDTRERFRAYADLSPRERATVPASSVTISGSSAPTETIDDGGLALSAAAGVRFSRAA